MIGAEKTTENSLADSLPVDKPYYQGLSWRHPTIT
jgi:hypothetical protein